MLHDQDSLQAATALYPLQQHPQFAAALAGMGRPIQQIVVPGQGRAQIMSRRIWPTTCALRVVSRGPVWDQVPTLATQRAAVNALRAQGVQIINAEDMSPNVLKAAGYRQIMTPATIALQDLRGGTDAMRARMTAKWRNALRKSEQYGVHMEVESYRQQRHKWILAADAAQQRQRRYAAFPAAVTLSYAVMNKDQVVVVTANQDGQSIAAMIFLCHGRSATYHIGWTAPAGREVNAHNLCLDTAMRALADRGVVWLDMGQIDTINAPGLARFKLGSGAQPRKLGGTWLSVPLLRRSSLA